MSLVDFDSIQDQHLIVQYVIECRGVGHFLPYGDYEVIRGWFEVCADVERLLLALEEHLPAYFGRHANKSQLPSLRGIDRRIKRCLWNQQLTQRYE